MPAFPYRRTRKGGTSASLLTKFPRFCPLMSTAQHVFPSSEIWLQWAMMKRRKALGVDGEVEFRAWTRRTYENVGLPQPDKTALQLLPASDQGVVR